MHTASNIGALRYAGPLPHLSVVYQCLHLLKAFSSSASKTHIQQPHLGLVPLVEVGLVEDLAAQRMPEKSVFEQLLHTIDIHNCQML